uniref:Plastocyanin-like domain-containing protein n=1 Tax=Scylla olivacea TaxID=85551 RepID=A0A0P4X1L0_SCYOL
MQVCEGDRLVVDLYNLLLSDTETIHWHGMHMRNQQYYDGVPFLTQCPVIRGKFRYDFKASTPGTLFWHSHAGRWRGPSVPWLAGSLLILKTTLMTSRVAMAIFSLDDAQ